MPDQIIDAEMAKAIQIDALRKMPLVAWIVLWDPPDYRGKFMARLVAADASVYVLLADTLAELHAQLPPGLVRSPRFPCDPPEMLEGWFSTP
jgi:hypothetical protein